ncbi:MAG: aminotransferase class III-fold pyridoxal phosphate-dependent enzyme, partial [Sphingomonadales bacterium]|nr:aminotransferase class III-fold pyridoxal phosphate-dependent enzyme [Sphingomonadales bacterium]
DMDATRAAIGDETAAVLVEPVQGEGGILPATPEDMQALRALCDEHGLLLMLDEIQCGMGRSGKLFAHEWAGITPDVVCSAKGIGGGFPLGAVLAVEKVAKSFSPGSHGTTYGGNPMAMAVGNAVLDVMLEDGFFDHVNEITAHLMTGLKALQDKLPETITDVRGLGLMIGVELTRPARPVLETLLEGGFLAASSGENIIRLLPPLNITDAEVDEAIKHLESALKA